MKILHLHAGPDTGGQSMGGKPILEAAGHEVRVFARPHPFGYPRTEPWLPLTEEAEEAFEWADLIVVHNQPRTYEMIARGRRKPLIVHHHGSRFRREPGLLWHYAAELGAVQVVSTVDLLLYAPPGAQLYWQPQNVNLSKMAAIRSECYSQTAKLRVIHAPTNRRIKGTAYVLAACHRAPEFSLSVVEHAKWESCLRIKATADVYVDQFLLGYGNNAIEAWAMGIPVVAGASPPILARMLTEWGSLPFLTSDGADLRQTLLALAGSADLRAEWAERGVAHVARFHAPGPWLARFEQLAALAIELDTKRPGGRDTPGLRESLVHSAA